MREVSRPLDLARGPLLRVRVLELGGDEYLLCVTVHHIVADGWSVGVLTREWSDVYGALVDGREPALEPLAVQYADFAAWQREWLQGEAFERHLDYWGAAVGGGARCWSCRPIGPAPLCNASPGGAHEPLVLGAALSSELRRLGHERAGSTLSMVLLGGFFSLLGRWSGGDGTSSSDRSVPAATAPSSRT